MSSFPPSRWEVRFVKDMLSMSCETPDRDEIWMAAFMALRPAGTEEGCFRFNLAGPSKLKVCFNMKEVLNSPLFDNMVAEAELNVGTRSAWRRTPAAPPGWTW